MSKLKNSLIIRCSLCRRELWSRLKTVQDFSVDLKDGAQANQRSLLMIFGINSHKILLYTIIGT